MSFELLLVEVATSIVGGVIVLGSFLLLGKAMPRVRFRREARAGRHRHRWHDKPYLTDTNTDIYSCQVPGCSAQLREPVVKGT